MARKQLLTEEDLRLLTEPQIGAAVNDKRTTPEIAGQVLVMRACRKAKKREEAAQSA